MYLFYLQVMWLVVTEVWSESLGPITQRRHYNACPIYVVLSYVVHVIFFIVECGIAWFLCAMRVFVVWTSSSSRRLALCQISFLPRPPLLRMEKNCVLNQSLTHPAYLIRREPMRIICHHLCMKHVRIYSMVPNRQDNRAALTAALKAKTSKRNTLLSNYILQLL